MVGREGGRQICDGVALGGSGTSPGGKRRLIRGGEGRSAARICNGPRPHVLFTSSRDQRVALPVADTGRGSGGAGRVHFPHDTTVGGTALGSGGDLRCVSRWDPEVSGLACVHRS